MGCNSQASPLALTLVSPCFGHEPKAKVVTIMDRKCVFIAWDHNGMIIKYLPCVFEKVHVLNVSNLFKDLLYEDILMEFHVYDTRNYFDTI
jgi:hypothetical protein